MNMISWSIIGLGAFVAIWMLFVVPAERRYHERKLALLQKRIELRQAQKDPESNDSSANPGNEREES